MARARRPIGSPPAAPATPAAPAPVPAAPVDMDTMVLMGIFGAAVGLKGEIRIKSYTQDPLDIAAYGPLVTRDGRRFEITAIRSANEVVVARLRGLNDRTAAEALTNTELFVPRAVLGAPEDEDEFYHADLIGLAVEDAAGGRLGTVLALHDFGAGDMIEIRPASGGRPLVYPFTKAVVPVVDIAGGRIVLVPPAEVDGDGP